MKLRRNLVTRCEEVILLCEVDAVNPPEFQMMDVMADSLHEVMAMLERGRLVIGREVDAQGCVKNDAIFIPSWRIIKIKVIGMGKSMDYELSNNIE